MSNQKRSQTQNYLSEGELEELLQQLKNERIRGVSKDDQEFYRTRNFIAALIASHCGLRREELSDLKWDHIDLNSRVMHVYEGKGDKDRVLGIPVRVADELSRWRTADYRHPSEYVLSTMDGDQWEPDKIYRPIHRAGEKAGIKPGRSIGPHDLRHTFSQHFQSQYEDISLTQQALGHSDIETTQLYVDERLDEVIDAMKRFGSSKQKTLKEEVQELKSMVRQLQLLLGNGSSQQSVQREPALFEEG